ncbi:MAG: NAD-binding protein [Phycisphaerales bacterium]|nr:NAD-binding protein [Phycisphaerales bacterium]MCI0677237.1 NAD-binding protein [Phycisphaerales bacterium]
MAVSVPRIELLEMGPEHRAPRRGSRLWREWCFARVAFRHFRLRFLIMAAILIGGGLLFILLEPEKNHSLPQAIFYTWSLVFGEAPEAFPKSIILRVMFFVVPALGLTVIIEAIIDFALMLRDRRRYERSWCTMLASSLSDHIVLVGFGKLGYQIFLLLRKLGEPVVVLERNADSQFLEELRRDGSPLLIGDARRDALLTEANIVKARSIILATDDDLANLEIALDARRLAPKVRVVLRMFDQNMADKLSDGFNIHQAMSQAALSAPTFAISAVAPSIVNSFILGNQLVVMQRWLVRADGPLTGKTISSLTTEFGLGAVEHHRPPDSPRLFPPPDLQLQPGDGVILQGPLHTLNKLWRENTRLTG